MTNNLRYFILFSLAYLSSAFTSNLRLSSIMRSKSYVPSRGPQGPQALQMCNMNTTDILDKIKNNRRDLLKKTPVLAASLAALLPLLPTLSFANSNEAGDDSWTQHNGVFTENEIKDFTKTDSGLLYKDVVVGKGNVPNDGDAVNINIVGYIFETGEKWTNTYKGIPTYNSVIRAGARPNQKFMKGLNEGVRNMKRGGKRILVIPAYLAYNYVTIYSDKNPGVQIIPGGAALVCYVEVVDFKPLP